MIRRLWWRLVIWVTPGWFWYGDHLTVSAKRFLLRIAVAILALLLGVFAIALSGPAFVDVVGGAMLGSAVSMAVWVVASYRGGREETKQEIKRVTELDVVHARLNQIAHAVGAPLLNLESEIEHATNARAERLAHFGGLDEYRMDFEHVGEDGYAFWDDVALGQQWERPEDYPGSLHNPEIEHEPDPPGETPGRSPT